MTWSFKTYQLPYGARILSFVPRFSSSVQLIGWEVFYRVSIQDSSSNRRVRSTKLASKKEGNCNVMITKPTNHMISTRDHSHDLLT